MPRVVHFEIYTDDPEAVQPFYRDVFGWKFNKFDGPIEYWTVTTGDDKQPGINGGITRPRPGQNPGTLNTVGVESLDQSIKRTNRTAEKSACRRWRFRRWAGWLTRKIREETCLELSNRTQARNRDKARSYHCACWRRELREPKCGVAGAPLSTRSEVLRRPDCS